MAWIDFLGMLNLTICFLNRYRAEEIIVFSESMKLLDDFFLIGKISESKIYGQICKLFLDDFERVFINC